MVDKEGSARIMDFGIARSLKAKGITGAGAMVGTPEYMSPEQVESKPVDQRSDIYSLGVILYEMVTGRVPFEGDTPLSVAVKHKTEAPRDPKQINTQIPEDLSRLILKCMDKNKEKRSQSASDVYSELIRIEEGIPTTERIEPKRKPITSREITVTFRLKKLIVPALVVVALAISGVFIWKLLPKKEKVPIQSYKPSIAVLPFTDFSPEKDQGHLCDGLAESIINALAKIKELRIPARTSTFVFKDEKMAIQEIGKKLNVQTVLEGSIQKSKNKIMISAQLINIPDGILLWAEQYHRDLDDIFAVQSEISSDIVEKLEINLLGDNRGQPFNRHLENKHKIF
jgi:TolB-like protein